jgi:hypothetical protein
MGRTVSILPYPVAAARSIEERLRHRRRAPRQLDAHVARFPQKAAALTSDGTNLA